MQFLTKAECEVALQELVSLKDQFDNVIINRSKSGCSVSARQSESFDSLEDAKAASNLEKWREVEAPKKAASLVPHKERLDCGSRRVNPARSSLRAQSAAAKSKSGEARSSTLEA
jgi:hypothetical protein